jgi:hypothetical protein
MKCSHGKNISSLAASIKSLPGGSIGRYDATISAVSIFSESATLECYVDVDADVDVNMYMWM